MFEGYLYYRCTLLKETALCGPFSFFPPPPLCHFPGQGFFMTYQMKEWMIPNFKIVTESNLQALLGIQIVALVKLNLSHQQVS